MNARIRAILGVVVMSVLLVLYFVFVGVRAVALISSGTVIAVVMGVCMLLLPIFGVWGLWREVRFGHASTRLADRLAELELMPEEPVAALPSGRPVRQDAEAAFPKYREEAEANPEAWTSWMRLGIVYDACGDRKRARAAIRQAMKLEGNEIRSSSPKN